MSMWTHSLDPVSLCLQHAVVSLWAPLGGGACGVSELRLDLLDRLKKKVTWLMHSS